MNQPLYVLVIAGGRGTRFWPRSRKAHPKQCLELQDEKSLLVHTIERISPLVPLARILVVTAAPMADAVRAQLPGLPPENVLVEPEGRNTAACVGWGSLEVRRRAGDTGAVVAVLPADHVVEDAVEFRAILASCADVAGEGSALVTIGIEPTRAETGFGYLKVGEALSHGDGSFHRVDSFVEKPDADTAAAYLSTGRFLWNAGMFVFSCDTVARAFATHLPETWSTLQEIVEDPNQLADGYATLERISIDHGIMERADDVVCIRGRFGWSDVGSWNSLAEHLPENEAGRGNVREAISVDASNCIVHAPGKVVALIGVEGLVVVDTEDALLVCRADRAQEVREVIAQLEARDLKDLL